MRAKGLKQSDAALVLKKLRLDEVVEERQWVYEFGTGESVEAWVGDAVSELERLKNEYASRDLASYGGEFDAKACVALHRALPIDLRVAASADFWRWLSIFHLRSVIEWRMARRRPGRTPEADPENFGVGDRWRNYPAKVWFRAELVRDTSDGADPYRLARRGIADFWESTVLRHRYSSCRTLVRALVRLQYPREGKFRGAKYVPTELSLNRLRDLNKRLRLYHATTTYEAFDDRQADAFLAALVQTITS